MTLRLGASRIPPAQLGKLFTRLTHALLASGCLAGCGSEPEQQNGGWQPVACKDQQPQLDLSEISATRSVDHIGIYVRSWSQVAGTANTWYPRLFTGAGCSGAGNQAACEAQLATLLPTTDCDQTFGCPAFVIVRSEDELTRLESAEQLLALLGTIDTSVEAMLLASFDENFPIGCPGTNGAGQKLRGTEFRDSHGGYQLRTHWGECTTGVVEDRVTVDSAGSLSARSRDMLSGITCIAGRRPHGLCRTRSRGARSPLGSFFAQAAQLEGASVFAFLQLARELVRLHAPRELIASCLQAVDEELRHTREMASLARRFGGAPTRPEVLPSGERSRFEIARDNAVEGCVRETYGALVATYQAESARDPLVRLTMQRICQDETRHARLSWELASWLEPQLSQTQQADLQVCREHAIAELRRELQVGLAAPDRLVAGLPDAEVAASMLNQLAETLWS